MSVWHSQFPGLGRRIQGAVAEAEAFAAALLDYRQSGKMEKRKTKRTNGSSRRGKGAGRDRFGEFQKLSSLRAKEEKTELSIAQTSYWDFAWYRAGLLNKKVLPMAKKSNCRKDNARREQFQHQ